MEYEDVEVNSERWFDLKPLLNEEFRDIKGYEGLYQISNYGRVKSLERKQKVDIKNNKIITVKERILKDKDRGNGYRYVILCKNSKVKFFGTHRLVAEMFLDKKYFKSMFYEDKSKISFEKLFVNHKDENPQNNKKDNLEWCTHTYNLNYGNCINKIQKKLSKRVNQYDLNGNFIKTWDSTMQIERELGINHSNISNCCTKKQNKSKGYIWCYE